MSTVFVDTKHVVKSHLILKNTWFNSLNFRLGGHLHQHNVNKCHVM